MKDLLRLLRRAVKAYRQREQPQGSEAEADLPVISLDEDQLTDAWTVERLPDETNEGGELVAVFIVRGKKIEKFARRTNFDQFEAVNRLRDIMKRTGITHELVRQGATGESVVRIGESELTLVEQ